MVKMDATSAYLVLTRWMFGTRRQSRKVWLRNLPDTHLSEAKAPPYLNNCYSHRGLARSSSSTQRATAATTTTTFAA